MLTWNSSATQIPYSHKGEMVLRSISALTRVCHKRSGIHRIPLENDFRIFGIFQILDI